MRSYLRICILFSFYAFIQIVGMEAMSQDSLAVVKKNDTVKHRVFANIFASYYYGFSDQISPKSAFEMPTALLGYSANFSDKLKATLIYDVTRTTNGIWVKDENDNLLEVGYFEGSKYTAFLKMAEIMYSVNRFIDFRVGQLLNTQYLTTQDKFWGYRYIYFTYQEVHRYGMPADFGAQVDFKYSNLILNQLSITNGEGPFRHQDINSKFLLSNNIEIRPIDGLILKLYTDFSAPSDTSALAKDKYAISFFTGYKNNKFRVGAEYNKVFNYGYLENDDFYGLSMFGSVSLNEKFDFLARYDYINKSSVYNLDKGHFVVTGFHYKPHQNFFCSLNLRALNPGQKYWVYTSFGVSF